MALASTAEDDDNEGVHPSSASSSSATELIHPDQLGPIPLPKTLSPSSIMEFKKCPQSFLFQYLYNLKQPTSLPLAKGSMCHEALEKVFDLDPQDRTLETLQNLLRVSWGDHRLSDTYRFLFETTTTSKAAAAAPTKDGSAPAMTTATTARDIPAEREWGKSALSLLENYYRLEDPRTVTRPNPLKREIWLNANLTVDPKLGTTGYTAAGGNSGNDSSTDQESSSSSTPDTFRVRGIVDRLDMVRLSSRKVAMRIVDYKTGKSPSLKYSKACNERIMNEAFYQLKIYALLLREKGAGADEPKGLDLQFLRLFYLTSEEGPAKYLDFDLGETQEERDFMLQEIHQDISNVWTSILDLVSKQDPKTFVGCDRSFCYCHKCRERFVPGSLWEPN
jgi:RecB family exonuclease